MNVLLFKTYNQFVTKVQDNPRFSCEYNPQSYTNLEADEIIILAFDTSFLPITHQVLSVVSIVAFGGNLSLKKALYFCICGVIYIFDIQPSW